MIRSKIIPLIVALIAVITILYRPAYATGSHPSKMLEDETPTVVPGKEALKETSRPSPIPDEPPPWSSPKDLQPYAMQEDHEISVKIRKPETKKRQPMPMPGEPSPPPTNLQIR